MAAEMFPLCLLNIAFTSSFNGPQPAVQFLLPVKTNIEN